MNNQTIGFAGVFALTFFLLALRHCIHLLGQPNRRRHVNPTTLSGNFEVHTKPVEDDSWLLWSPDTEGGVPNRGDETTSAAPVPRDKRGTLLRLITGR